MFKDEVVRLYETLDFERQAETDPEHPIQLFRRTEGATVTHELLWILSGRETHQDAYSVFSSQIQGLINVPGQKRMRLVAASDEDLDSFTRTFGTTYQLHTDVSRYSWIALLNDLFRSEQFCSKTIREYENYQNSLSIQLSGLTEVDNATWSYLPQTLRKSNGDRVSFSVFLDELLLTPWNAPKLFVIHAPASYGKTAFSYASTKKLAEQHMLNAGHAFPIFIPFAKYRRFGGIRDILRAEIEELQLYGVNSRALLQLIHWGRAVVILDGFDELIAEVGLDSARANLRALKEFLGGEARLLLTTRTAFLSTNAEVLEALQPDERDEIEILRLEPFDRKDQGNYLRAIGVSGSDIEVTLSYLDNFPALPELATSPLLLNTIARLAKRPDQRRPQIEELYDLHVSTLCARERDRQNHDLSDAIQMELLSKLALSMYQDSVFQYDHSLLEVYWEEARERLLQAGVLPADSNALRPKLLSHALLNSAHEGDPFATGRDVGFIHPSFRDHFVASQIDLCIAQRSVTSEVRSCIRRPISNDLAEMLSYRVHNLNDYLRMFLEDKNPGVASALNILMASVRQELISADECERALLGTLETSEVEHVVLASMRLEFLRFTEWAFRSWDFNGAKLVNCEFLRCDFSSASMYGTVIIDSNLEGSTFGDANLLNSLGVVQDEEIEYLYDNNEIRLWLISNGAKVKSDDLRILTAENLPSNELLEHIFRKFYPKGSIAQQRHVQRTSLTKSLPPHRVAEVEKLVGWLVREDLFVPGPTLRQRRTLEISGEWRDDIAAWMREGLLSPRVEDLITRSLSP